MLADRKAPVPIHGSPCSVRALIDSLPAKEADAFSSMLEDPNWSSEDIWLACRDEDYQVGRQTIGRHRRRQCRCWTNG